MKKIIWYCSITVIFLNMVIATIYANYPMLNSILLNFSVLAIAFMIYVIFFEKKTSAVLRNISLVFGLAGITKMAFDIMSLNSFIANAILLAVTTSTLIIVFLPVFIQMVLKDKA